MAIYRQGTGKTKEACRLYEQYIKYQPKDNTNFLVYLNLGLCQIELGRLRDAERTLRGGVEKCGRMWELNLILGVVLSDLGRHKEAIEALVATLEPNSRSQMYFPFRRKLWEIWDLIAFEFAVIGDRSSAFAAWTRAAELSSDVELQKRYMTMAQSVASPEIKNA
jgi:Putative Zn-dependent protease, contains TPR repeats